MSLSKQPFFYYKISLLALIIVLTPFLLSKVETTHFNPIKGRVSGQLQVVTDTRLPLVTPTQFERTLYVSVNGVNIISGGSKDRPFKTISYALDRATPGTRIVIKSGTYPESLMSKRNGSSTKPISLEAEGNVILTGDKKSGRIFELRHDYHIISGFEFTSNDNHIWIQEGDHNIIKDNYFHHADGECIRIKYQSTNNIVERNRIEHCGLDDYVNNGGGKNGEGIYIGTAPEQLAKNPTRDIDKSHANIVRNNTINTFANECVDIKEGSSFNIVEFNNCTGQKDKNSGGMNSRGDENIFRYNHIFNNIGAGIRLGGDEKSDGIKNEAYGNKIENNKFVAIKVEREPQGTICGNIHTNNRKFSNENHIKNPTCRFKLSPPGVQK